MSLSSAGPSLEFNFTNKFQHRVFQEAAASLKKELERNLGSDPADLEFGFQVSCFAVLIVSSCVCFYVAPIRSIWLEAKQDLVLLLACQIQILNNLHYHILQL